MPNAEGTVDFTVDYQGTAEMHQTWYRIVGDTESERPPLIALHGGPGATHDYLLSLGELGTDRAVVFYDQLGNGRSTRRPERGAEEGERPTQVVSDWQQRQDNRR